MCRQAAERLAGVSNGDFRLSYSGKSVHSAFASCGQEAFFAGHVHALQTLGGILADQGPLRQPEI
jgi:hypothetical protein